MSANKQRMNVYIDLNNLEKGSEQYNQMGLVINYTTLIDIVSEGYTVNKVYFFDSEPSKEDEPSNNQLARIHMILEGAGYIPQLYKPQNRSAEDEGRTVQKEVDTAFCCLVDKENYKDLFDVALFIAGDRDMCPAVRNIHDEGKKVIAVAFEDNFAECLRNLADEHIFVEDLNCMEIVSEFGYMNRINTASPLTAVNGGE